MLRSWAIYQLCQSMPGTAQGQVGTKQGQSGTRQGQTGTSEDKQGHSLFSLLVPTCPCLFPSIHACPCLSLSVPVFPCLSLFFPVCPCPSLSVPFCFYICYAFKSTPAYEYYSCRQYEYTYIDFHCKSHCSNARKPF